jgi:hypothetical protein
MIMPATALTPRKETADRIARAICLSSNMRKVPSEPCSIIAARYCWSELPP